MKKTRIRAARSVRAGIAVVAITFGAGTAVAEAKASEPSVIDIILEWLDDLLDNDDNPEELPPADGDSW